MNNLASVISLSPKAAKTTRPVNNHQSALATPDAFLSQAMASCKLADRSEERTFPKLASPFQASLLFTAVKQRSPKSGFAAFVCYLNGKQVVDVERLHGLRGHNPTVNLTTVINRAKRQKTITGVIVATWVESTSEAPYAEEFKEEVYRQYDVLADAGITLVDNLRLSETGVFSYYGQHQAPYCDSPSYHEKSICRLY